MVNSTEYDNIKLVGRYIQMMNILNAMLWVLLCSSPKTIIKKYNALY
jgi:hypothetical protein